jgi:hypothetical protein
MIKTPLSPRWWSFRAKLDDDDDDDFSFWSCGRLKHNFYPMKRRVPPQNNLMVRMGDQKIKHGDTHHRALPMAH